MPADCQFTMSPKELADLPDEITTNIVRHMDNLSTVCFALTSHRSLRIVYDIYRQPLKTLCPVFEGESMVQANGSTQHENLIRQLWQWLSKRCLFCGVPEEQAKEYKQHAWTYSRHVCSGWLRRPNAEDAGGDRILYNVDVLASDRSFQRGMIEEYIHSGKISEAALDAWLNKTHMLYRRGSR